MMNERTKKPNFFPKKIQKRRGKKKTQYLEGTKCFLLFIWLGSFLFILDCTKTGVTEDETSFSSLSFTWSLKQWRTKSAKTNKTGVVQEESSHPIAIMKSSSCYFNLLLFVLQYLSWRFWIFLDPLDRHNISFKLTAHSHHPVQGVSNL